MDNDAIDNLRDALRFSPNNIPLKQILADSLFNLNRFDEAEGEFTEILTIENNNFKAKLGLAKIYFYKESYSTCNVILEELLRSSPNDIEILVMYAKALIKEKSFIEAIKVYQSIQVINPDFKDDELDTSLKRSEIEVGTSYEDLDDFLTSIEKPKITFEHVGGMQNVKKEIEMKIIHPLNHPDLYKAYGKKIGGGILLYGPPGCGKTHIARATAGQVKAKFISVGLNEILDMWIGNSEKNLHLIFETARRNAPCVLFFDEIDALGANRTDMKHSGNRQLINQFLQELDGVDNSNEGVLILGATNTPWHLDPAFRRPGRFDRIIFVPPPDAEARESILKIKLKDKPVENIDYRTLAKNTPEYSGADLEALVDISIEQKLEEAFKDGIPKPIKTKDLINAGNKHKASTKEWFSVAKNFALYANDSGLYDDILTFMKIKK